MSTHDFSRTCKITNSTLDALRVFRRELTSRHPKEAPFGVVKHEDVLRENCNLNVNKCETGERTQTWMVVNSFHMGRPKSRTSIALHANSEPEVASWVWASEKESEFGFPAKYHEMLKDDWKHEFFFVVRKRNGRVFACPLSFKANEKGELVLDTNNMRHVDADHHAQYSNFIEAAANADVEAYVQRLNEKLEEAYEEVA